MTCIKKLAVAAISLLCIGGISACEKPKESDSLGDKNPLVLEMDMEEHYSPIEPFENGRIFCVSEDLDTLKVELTYQMDGESGSVELVDRSADKVLWGNTWKGDISQDSVSISLENLKKEKEYAVQFTGMKIKHANVKLIFPSELVQEKEMPNH